MKSQKNANVAIANPLTLQGKTVLVTRPKDQAEEFALLLQHFGARVVFVPTIQIIPPATWDQCDAAIDALDKYDGFVITSANAARYFFRRLGERKTQSTRTILKDKVFYAVGSKTGDALAKEEIRPTIFSDVNDARSLAEALLKLPLRGKRFLFPKGNLAGGVLPDVLRSHGAMVDEVVVYETVAPRDEDAKFVRESLAQETIDVVTFFSPSSVKHLLAAVGREMFSSRVIAAIGSSTAEAIEGCGFKAGIVAPKPTAVDLADAIARYYSTTQHAL